MSATTWNWDLVQVLGSFDPLRNIVWVFYSTDDTSLDVNLVTFNHEYNHLIGIVGRHLQICLLDLYLSSSPYGTIVVNNERAIVESFVPVWLSSPSRMGSSVDPLNVAPESDTVIVKQITQVCRNLKKCHWVMDDQMITLTFEGIVRALQQTILNVGKADSPYSPDASMTALRCLSKVSETIRGKTVTINRTRKGEYHLLEVGLLDKTPVKNIASKTHDQSSGELLELFLLDRIRRESGLEPKRYTLHNRAELVLKWICRILSSNHLAELATGIFAGIISVFMPRMFLPLVCFWEESSDFFQGELYALPFPPRPMSMPIFTHSKEGLAQESIILPTHILQLQNILWEIRQQSTCELGFVMSDFGKFLLGEVTFEPFGRRTIATFSAFGEALERFLRSLQATECPACSSLRANISGQCLEILTKEAKSLVQTVGVSYASWLTNHAKIEFQSVNTNVASGKQVSVQINRETGKVYQYL